MTSTSWYDLLGVSPDAGTADIAAAAEKLSRQAAAMANTAPERSQQLRERVRALKADLVSGAEARHRYDASLSTPQAPDAPPPAPSCPASAHDAPAPAPGRAATWAPPARSTDELGQMARKASKRFVRFLQTGWTCPACGEGALPSDRFCPKCGTLIPQPGAVAVDEPVEERGPLECRECGSRVPRGKRFCTSCGMPQG